MIDNILNLHINSKDRYSGTTSNFIYKISLPADIKNTITHCSIIMLSVPKSFYQIEEGLNNFILNENGTNITITILPGNYKKIQLFNKLISLLNSATLNNLIYNIEDEYNDHDTGKLKITITNNINNYQVYLLFNKNDIYKILGFTFNKNYYFNNNILTSENVINLNRESNLYLHSNIIRNKNNILNVGNDVLTILYTNTTLNFSYIIKDYELLSNMKDFKY